MKHYLLLVVCILISSNLNAQKLDVDNYTEQGWRNLITQEYPLCYSRDDNYARFRLTCISTPDTTAYRLQLIIYQKNKIQIEKGRKVLFKYDDGSITELDNDNKISFQDAHFSTYGPYGNLVRYFIVASYVITPEQINSLINGKVVKIRIEHDVDVLDYELKKNRFAKNLNTAYESIMQALNKKRDVYSGF